MTTPEFDLVLYGATSFAGEITARYLVEHYGVGASLKWAAAGRSRSKLETLRDSLGPEAASLELLVADAHDAEALGTMCERTRVVVSTVGPYDLYGSTLIEACVTAGTDYCDLTGEIRWVRRMFEQHGEAAGASGARIVNSCGFDSLPSDMGVQYLQAHAMERFGSYCNRVKYRSRAASGAFSGGTVATMLNENEVMAANPGLEEEVSDPYYGCPPGYRNSTPQHRVNSAEYDPDFQEWIAPFVMAAINEPVVFRTQALAGHPYGEDFTYNEAMLTAPGMKGRLVASMVSGGMKGFTAATRNKTMRGFLEKRVLPSPGEGPSPEAQEKGFYDIRMFGATPAGETLQVKITGDRDPGYGSTAKMLAECGVSLVQDIAKSDKPGGFWTPASVFDQVLIDRLCSKAGMTFEVLS